MNWIQKLERKFGKYAIPNLMLYVVMLYLIGFILMQWNPEIYYNYLSLDARAILQGQVWRIFTFIVKPPDTRLFYMLVGSYFYYVIGHQLELIWGTFKFNLYFIMGVVFHVVAALITYFVLGASLPIGTMYLNLSLFLAYAAMFPNREVYFMWVLPVKIKYFAALEMVYFIYAILQAFMPTYGGNPLYGFYYKANALSAVVSLLNFLIFLLSMRNMSRFSPKEVHRKHVYQKEVRAGKAAQMKSNGAKHRCAVCGRTELDDENLEFRYCSKCNGNYEYCQDHLFTHEHVK